MFKVNRKWEKIGTVVRPTFMEMRGKKNEKKVVWIDNWERGNYAVIVGEESHSKKDKPSTFATYEEKEVLANVGNMKDAKRIQKEYMEKN